MENSKIPKTHTMLPHMISLSDQWLEISILRKMLNGKVFRDNWPIFYQAYEYTHDIEDGLIHQQTSGKIFVSLLFLLIRALGRSIIRSN